MAHQLLATDDVRVYLVEETANGVTDWTIMKHPPRSGTGQRLYSYKAPNPEEALKRAEKWMTLNYPSR